MVPKVCSVDPKGSAAGSHGIRGYISVMATLKCTFCFKSRNKVLLKIIAIFL